MLQNHREQDLVPFGREHFVVASLREPHTGLAADSCCKTSSSAAWFNERGCVAKIGDCGAGDDGNRISWRMLLVTDKDRSKLQSTFSAMTTFLVIL